MAVFLSSARRRTSRLTRSSRKTVDGDHAREAGYDIGRTTQSVSAAGYYARPGETF
jgi:hypothetical protein